MMRWIIGWSMKYRLFVIAFAVAIMVLGINQMRDIQVDTLPEFAPPYVEVQTEALGLSAPEVEELVTLNLEELLNGTPWLQSMSSTSVAGLSSITLIFQPGTDIIRARQLVSERLSLAYAIPNVAQSPVILPPLSATSRVMMVGMSSKQVSAIEMSVLARWNIRPALLSVPGVANVAIWGMRDRQLQVLVDPAKLSKHHVTLDQIVSTTGNALWVSPLSFLNASTPGSGGWIDGSQQRIEVRHVLPIASPTELSKVNVENTRLTLGDVAAVVEDHQPLIGDDILSSNTNGLLIVIEKFPGTNPQEVTRGVEAKLAELQPGLAGIQIDTNIFRPANFIDMAIGNISWSLLTGLFLLVLVLLFTFYNWRIALISLVAIPLSLLAAGLVLYWRGYTMNAMALSGLLIAIAIIIDDAVIDVENIVRRLRQHRMSGDTRSTTAIILESSIEMRSVMLFAMLIILIILLPIFLLQGVTGAFFQPLAISFGLALITSMVVALTATPALGLLLLQNGALERHRSPLLHWLQRGHEAALRWLIRVLRPTIIAIGVLIISVFTLAGLAVIPAISGVPILASFKEPNVMIHWQAPPGTSYTEMTRITTLASRELRSISGVRNVAVDVGRAVLGDQVVDVNSAQLVVSIDPAANYDTTMATIRKVAGGYPGIRSEVQTYLKEATSKVLTGTSNDIVVRIFGPDLGILRSKAEEVRSALSQIDGTTDVHTELQVEQPQVQIEVDLAKAQKYGLKPGDVRRAASTLVAGIEAGSLFEEQKVFQVVVWGTPQVRSNLTSIRDLLIDTPNGGQVRLGDVANVSIVPTPNLIQHQTVSRRIDVGLNIQGRDPNAVVSDIQHRLSAIHFPLEYRSAVLGAYQEQQNDRRNLLIFGLVAAFGIFLLLQAAFGSWRLAAIALLSLPTALLGCVLASLIYGGVISLAAMLGLLGVFGVAIRNLMMLIKHYQRLEQEECISFGLDLVLQGTRERFAPIIITLLATGLAFLPLAVAGTIPGQEIASPLAVVVMCGLISSALFNLFIVPVLYLRFGTTSQTGPSIEIPHVQYESIGVASQETQTMRRNSDEV